MRALIQRVSRASVSVDGKTAGSIAKGFLVLLGVAGEDGNREARFLAEKTANLRVLEDEEGKMNLSLLEAEGAALVVSQFTLHADVKKGRRPSFVKAAPPERAEALYELYAQTLREMGIPVQTGVFGAKMVVELENEGPVTILLDTEELL